MSVLKKLFSKKRNAARPAIPPWDEIVDHMQGEGLSDFVDRIVRVISSKDGSKRIVILQSENGYFKTVYEEIQVFDEEEWIYFCNDPNRYPAWWEPVSTLFNSNSFYGTEEDAIKDVIDSHEYRTYFI